MMPAWKAWLVLLAILLGVLGTVAFDVWLAYDLSLEDDTSVTCYFDKRCRE